MTDSTTNNESKLPQKTSKNTFDWEAIRDGPSLFDHFHSFDPGEVEYEWDMLGQDTALLQLLTLPEVTRYAVVKCAKEMFGDLESAK